MRAKTTNRFDALREKALADDVGVAEQPVANRRPTVLAKRQQSVTAAASGKIKTVKIISHDPKRIRPWAGHNRDYGALSEARCMDLIEGFKRANQQFPAIVRKVADSDQFDYEFICGARRHWTANYLERDLLIEVRNLEDRDAFILQDIENRDREDISDYERACDYSRALPEYFDGNQRRMAEQLQIDPGNFARFLALAELPKEIVSAYSDVRELLTHHGTTYHKLLKDSATAKRLIDAAKSLKKEKLAGKKVVAKLKLAAAGSEDAKVAVSQSRSTVKKYGAVAVKQGRAGEITAQFKLPTVINEQSVESLKQDLLAMLDDMAGQKA